MKNAATEGKSAAAHNGSSTEPKAAIAARLSQAQEEDAKENQIRVALEVARELWKLTPLICVTAIVPDGYTDTHTFDASQEEELAKWLRNFSGVKNIYVMVNRPRRVLEKKATKDDVSHANAFYADVDPEDGADPVAEDARMLGVLQSATPPPSIIHKSGSGYQAWWLLREAFPLDTPAAVKAYESRNGEIARKYGGDKVGSCEHLLRLPGPPNLPNRVKRAKGRGITQTAVVKADWGLRYELTDFQPLAATSTGAHQGDDAWNAPVEIGTLEPVDLSTLSIKDEFRELITTGNRADKAYGSRSEALFAALCELVRVGCANETMASIILDASNGISASVLDKRDPRKYAARQIGRARAFAEDFTRDTKGEVHPSQDNIRKAVRRLGVELAYNEFARRTLVSGLPGFPPELGDPAANRLWLQIERQFGFRPAQKYFNTVVEDWSRSNAYHPVLDYLASLRWDGTPRLDSWLVQYGGAEDSEYTRAVGSITLIAAVRRVRTPGCKFDELLILQGPQGTNKSSCLQVLAVLPEWFSDSLALTADSKRVIESLDGRWIVEVAELSGMRRGEIEHVKALTSRGTDRARMSYDRFTDAVPRQCVIIGTTNGEKFLRDTTGNRRFWPVRVKAFDLEKLRHDRDQLWAEAAAREAKGDSIRLDPSLYEAAGEQQQQRQVDDPMYERLHDLLGDSTGRITAEDVWTLVGIPPGQRKQDHNALLGEAMKRLGWEKPAAGIRVGGPGPVNGYRKGTPVEHKQRLTVHTDSNGRATIQIGGAGVRDEGSPF